MLCSIISTSFKFTTLSLYNEIIICRFYGLDEDTKEEIMNRAGVSMNNIKLVPDKEEKI